MVLVKLWQRTHPYKSLPDITIINEPFLCVCEQLLAYSNPEQGTQKIHDLESSSLSSKEQESLSQPFASII